MRSRQAPDTPEGSSPASSAEGPRPLTVGRRRKARFQGRLHIGHCTVSTVMARTMTLAGRPRLGTLD